jgi:DNA recombination protein RmuC
MTSTSANESFYKIVEQSSIGIGAIVLGVVVIVLLLVILLKIKNTAYSGDELGLGRTRSEHDDQLRNATSRADIAETLITERETEVDRLRVEISTMQRKAETDQAQILELSGKISGLESLRIADAATISEQRSAGERSAALIEDLRKKVETEQRAQQDLNSKIAELKTQIEAERKNADEKIALLVKIRDDMQERFRQLADEALKTQGETFSKANVEKLEATLSPLKEHVGHFEKELREVHQETVKDRERLKSEIAQLTRRSESISQEALALTRALRGDHQRQGAWGEMILESILDRSGLREGEEYNTQANRVGAEGERLRPDVVVKIPGGKSLVIDSKVSLNDYAIAVNSTDEAEAASSRKRHVAAMRAHINGLTLKSYQMAEGQSVDYVIMFVPIEGALSEALRGDSTLTEYALERNITIATPTTLMMALRTVYHVWAVERRNQNAENIAKRAGLLYDKVYNFVTSMEKIGKGIETAQGAYENAFGQLSRGRGNVLSQIETLKALGASATKTIVVDFEGKAESQALMDKTETAGELLE